MTPPAPPNLDDYDAIAEAVMETARGRWFLTEFARRNRSADTILVLEAVARLEGKLNAPPPIAGDASSERLGARPEAIAAGVARLREAIDTAEPGAWRAVAAERLRDLEGLLATDRAPTLPVVEALPEIDFAQRSAASLQLAPPLAPDRADDSDEQAAWRAIEVPAAWSRGVSEGAAAPSVRIRRAQPSEAAESGRPDDGAPAENHSPAQQTTHIEALAVQRNRAFQENVALRNNVALSEALSVPESAAALQPTATKETAVQPRRPPTLLDSLSDDDKAILFG